MEKGYFDCPACYCKEVAIPMLCIGIIPVALIWIMCLIFNVKGNLYAIAAKASYTSILVKIGRDLLYIEVPYLRPMIAKIFSRVPMFEDVAIIVKSETEWQ